ncbi:MULTISPECIES: hypothetical protein [Micrococcaceae]|uniref:hypothetical protein n=1 Tax=Micrococcaceae TaxID=1268 RepID=UPI0011814674|nr:MULTISPECIES: hypothetical protein [Micrococcaceae]MBP2267266.1 hypothetical protein [Pseudarthrobacter sp. PvP004]
MEPTSAILLVLIGVVVWLGATILPLALLPSSRAEDEHKPRAHHPRRPRREPRAVHRFRPSSLKVRSGHHAHARPHGA